LLVPIANIFSVSVVLAVELVAVAGLPDAKQLLVPNAPVPKPRLYRDVADMAAALLAQKPSWVKLFQVTITR
jgi:hypothetical protein